MGITVKDLFVYTYVSVNEEWRVGMSTSPSQSLNSEHINK